MPLRIVQYNNPVLRKKGEKITVFGPVLRPLAEAMIETMHEAGGIGLAAQQVGRAVQLCVMDLRESESVFSWDLDGRRIPLEILMPLVMLNPKVTPAPGAPVVESEEGCLSFEDIRGEVPRPASIAVAFSDEAGGAHVLQCDGLLARCVQHEADHLNGILFIDRMGKATRARIDEAVKALAKRTRAEAKAARQDAKAAGELK
jgi:peptide deformylase